MRPVLLRLVLGLVVATVAACGGDRPRVTATSGPSPVERAIPSMEQARAATTASLDQLLATAAVIDQKDADGAAGDRSAMQRDARAHPLSSEQLRATGIGLRSGAQSYASAVEVLAAASARSQVPQVQRVALDEVVRAARAEATACSALARLAESVWPSYRTLAALQSKWLTRARAGWYRNRKEAAAAYAVLTSDVRPRVSAARPQLVAAADERALAQQAYATAVKQLRASIQTPMP